MVKTRALEKQKGPVGGDLATAGAAGEGAKTGRDADEEVLGDEPGEQRSDQGSSEGDLFDEDSWVPAAEGPRGPEGDGRTARGEMRATGEPEHRRERNSGSTPGPGEMSDDRVRGEEAGAVQVASIGDAGPSAAGRRGAKSAPTSSGAGAKGRDRPREARGAAAARELVEAARSGEPGGEREDATLDAMDGANAVVRAVLTKGARGEAERDVVSDVMAAAVRIEDEAEAERRAGGGGSRARGLMRRAAVAAMFEASALAGEADFEDAVATMRAAIAPFLAAAGAGAVGAAVPRKELATGPEEVPSRRAEKVTAEELAPKTGAQWTTVGRGGPAPARAWSATTAGTASTRPMWPAVGPTPIPAAAQAAGAWAAQRGPSGGAASWTARPERSRGPGLATGGSFGGSGGFRVAETLTVGPDGVISSVGPAPGETLQGPRGLVQVAAGRSYREMETQNTVLTARFKTYLAERNIRGLSASASPRGWLRALEEFARDSGGVTLGENWEDDEVAIQTGISALDATTSDACISRAYGQGMVARAVAEAEASRRPLFRAFEAIVMDDFEPSPQTEHMVKVRLAKVAFEPGADAMATVQALIDMCGELGWTGRQVLQEVVCRMPERAGRDLEEAVVLRRGADLASLQGDDIKVELLRRPATYGITIESGKARFVGGARGGRAPERGERGERGRVEQEREAKPPKARGETCYACHEPWHKDHWCEGRRQFRAGRDRGGEEKRGASEDAKKDKFRGEAKGAEAAGAGKDARGDAAKTGNARS